MRLLTIGDSWTYGIELWDPTLGPQQFYFPIEDNRHNCYREEHVWPTQVARSLGFDEVVNLSWPGIGNDTIVRRLMRWLANEKYFHNRSGEDLFVIIGWTSPERKDFFLDDPKISERWPYSPEQSWVTLTPWWRESNHIPEIDELSEVYYSRWCNPGEYLQRYIHQLFQVQSLLTMRGIRFLQFQAFYEHQNLPMDHWDDQNYGIAKQAQLDEGDRQLWGLIDPIRFYNKESDVKTFHNFLKSKKLFSSENLFLKTHPSAIGHKFWAEELVTYIKKMELLKK